MQSLRASDFEIREAGSALLGDRDGDGFHREFRIRFDADVIVGDAQVFAKLYLRRYGDADWLLYHVTDDFWINGGSSSDDYFVTTVLEDGYASAEYDVLIDLYEVGYSGVVATLDASESLALSLLPLEEISVDAPIEIAGFELRDIVTTLLIDDDADGHYSRFRITFDPDADLGGAFLYARIWVRPLGGEWIEEHVSDDFLVDTSGADDAFSITADWISGYPTAYYDVQIDLYDSATNLLAASAGSERPELAVIPLEDQARDVRPTPPVPGGNVGSTISRERGGGAMDAMWTLALVLLLLTLRGGVAAKDRKMKERLTGSGLSASFAVSGGSSSRRCRRLLPGTSCGSPQIGARPRSPFAPIPPGRQDPRARRWAPENSSSSKWARPGTGGTADCRVRRSLRDSSRPPSDTACRRR
jgi:hypothetical protein